MIQDNIYQNKVEFLHGKREDVVPVMKALGVHADNFPSEESGLVVEATRCFVIWVEDVKDIPVLIHEIYHLVDDIFKFHGVEGDNHSEFGAKLAEYYMREILKHLEG